MLTQEDVDRVVAAVCDQLEIRRIDSFFKGAAFPGAGIIQPEFVLRDGRWPRLRKAFLVAHPHCFCGSVIEVVPHHIKPVHLFPELELDPENLITFCPSHHLLFGHLMNWRAYNPTCREDAVKWNSKITLRPMAAPPQARLAQGLNHPVLVLERYEAFVRQYDPEGK